jgi:hypothetical protein
MKIRRAHEGRRTGVSVLPIIAPNQWVRRSASASSASIQPALRNSVANCDQGMAAWP